VLPLSKDAFTQVCQQSGPIGERGPLNGKGWFCDATVPEAQIDGPFSSAGRPRERYFNDGVSNPALLRPERKEGETKFFPPVDTRKDLFDYAADRPLWRRCYSKEQKWDSSWMGTIGWLGDHSSSGYRIYGEVEDVVRGYSSEDPQSWYIFRTPREL